MAVAASPNAVALIDYNHGLRKIRFSLAEVLMRSLALVAILLAGSSFAAEKPNIVFLMCDDLGYGDVHCLAPETSKTSTPGAEQWAREGMVFTDAHSGSSVCTPTRYGIMTGRYSWRTTLQKGVVTGFAPCLINKDRPTVAGFLKTQGYHTAIIGKWHLDFQYLNPKTGEAYTSKEHKSPPVGATIPDGPVHRGFDYFHGFHHARNMEAVIEDDRVIAHDDTINMLPRLTKQTVDYVASRAGKPEPFFLYVPLGSPHTPIVPSPDWQGKSVLGKYGDFVMQTDNVVVQLLAALQKHGMEDNTLFIFTSDNGCSRAADIKSLAAKGHSVSAHLRGSKADIWDGGHRIPFIARWPGKIKAGETSDQLICLADFFATSAEIVGTRTPPGSCEDSVSFLPAFFGQPIQAKRAGVVHHSFSGHFAYRQGKWKLVLARGSGGWSSPKEGQVSKDAPKAQLYDMEADPGEKNSLYSERKDLASSLLRDLEADVTSGRSTPGPPSKNDVARIDLWKSEPQPGEQPKKKTKEKTKGKAKS